MIIFRDQEDPSCCNSTLKLAWWDLETKSLAAVFKGPSFVCDDEGHVRSLEPAAATRAAAVRSPAP